jgi:putative multiple sugar transport system permease protein
VLAIGMVLVIIAGHIDLSVGSIAAFVGIVVALAMRSTGACPGRRRSSSGWSSAAIIGAWQGFWVAYVGIPAFIVTLAGMLIFRGLTLVIGIVAIVAFVFSQIRTRRTMRTHDLRVEPSAMFFTKLIGVSVLIAVFTWILAQSAIGTPYVLILVAVLIFAYAFLMGRTVFGRHIYAIGGNVHAAVLSGVNVKTMNFRIFINIGLLAAIAAVVTTSRAGAALAAAGNNYELDAIAACFIGGTAVTGGVGKVSGVIVGALIMGVLNMGLSILGTNPALQNVIKGLVLLIAVAFDLVNKRRAAGA